MSPTPSNLVQLWASLKEELLLALFPLTSLCLSLLSTRPGNSATTKTVLLIDLTEDLVSFLPTFEKEKSFLSDQFAGLVPATEEVYELALKCNRNPLLPMGMAVILNSIISSHKLTA